MHRTLFLAPLCLAACAAPAAADPGAWIADGAEVTLVNAYDAFGVERQGLKHDFGFSAVIRAHGKTILFDSGTRADIFADNLAALGITPGEIDIAIGSHSHHDHIAGFDYLLRENPDVELLLPKDFFGLGAPVDFPFEGHEPEVAGTLPAEQCYYGGTREVGQAPIVSTGRFWEGNVTWVTETTTVAPGITIVPTTSELMGTFIGYPPFGESPRLIGMPELSLSLATSQGEVVVVGCSHSSLESIVEAVVASGRPDIHLIAGGYHLIPYGRAYLEGLVGRLKDDFGVESVAPAHCTGHLAFSIFRAASGDAYRFFGLGTTLGI
jgi:7,8-dihydropterin-6-yl-methyl-4-(beta-D-ribofuranosyl)aminobenzene 5'-phosphate synthase